MAHPAHRAHHGRHSLPAGVLPEFPPRLRPHCHAHSQHLSRPGADRNQHRPELRRLESVARLHVIIRSNFLISARFEEVCHYYVPFCLKMQRYESVSKKSCKGNSSGGGKACLQSLVLLCQLHVIFQLNTH